MYTGNSIVDYLRTTGQPSDYASRAKLAASKGIANYAGTAEQNTQLLNTLRGTAPVASQPVPQLAPAPQPQPQIQQPRAAQIPSPAAVQTQPSSAGQPQSAQDLVNMGFYGYAGWGNAEAVADFKATGGQGKGGPTASASVGATGAPGGFMAQPTIDLPAIYKNLSEGTGISAKEEELGQKTRAFNDAISKINDNPFLSEANRVGRIQKLQIDFNNATQAVRDEIATKKADIETQLNLQMKQFDINSQQAQQALTQFGVLLDAGALNNATGEDIANITRSTGLSSSIIQSAINAKIQSGYSTQIKSFDDGANEGFILYTVDQLGNIVNQTRQVTGTSSKTTGTGTYSADPAVSAFLQRYLSQNQQPDISDMWGELGL